MRILTVILIVLKLICEVNGRQPTHVDHMCSVGASIEQAGMGSGTLTFKGKCEITITDIPEFKKKNSERIDQVNRLNVVGVAKTEGCNTSKKIVIDSEAYCRWEWKKDTVITVIDQQMKFSVAYDQANFTLSYYRGEP